MKGQLSAEMLIVLVVILGIAVLLAGVMMKSANKASEKVSQKADTVLSASDGGALKGATGEYCAHDSDCSSGFCDTYSEKCS